MRALASREWHRLLVDDATNAANVAAGAGVQHAWRDAVAGPGAYVRPVTRDYTPDGSEADDVETVVVGVYLEPGV